jgi:hypothetical protein
MNSESSIAHIVRSISPIAALGLIFVLFLLFFFIFYRRKFLGTTWGPLLWLGAAIASILLSVVYIYDLRHDMNQRFYTTPLLSNLFRALSVVARGAIVFVLVPFAIRLFNKWTGPLLTEAEKIPGSEGFRAWLGVRNVLLAVLISLCAWLGYGYSFWAMLVVTAGLVLAYPIITTIGRVAEPSMPPSPPVDLTNERQRVLKLLEDGKITADECAELLNSLGETARPTAAPILPPATPVRKLLLIGGALVLVGFFLPWISINPDEELSRVQQQWSQNMPNTIPTFQFSTRTMHFSGGEIGDHLGWLVLFLGVGAAALPYLSTNIQFSTRRSITLVALGAGALILLYVLTSRFHNASIGLLVAMAGYVLEIISATKEGAAA